MNISRSFTSVLLFITFSLFSQLLCAQNLKRDTIRAGKILKKTINLFPNDYKSMFSITFKEGNKSGLYALGIGGLILTDSYTTPFVQDKIEPRFKKPSFPYLIPKKIRKSSKGVLSTRNQYLIPGLVGMYATGLVFKSQKMQEASLLSAKAIIHSYVVTHLVLKTLFARNRPHKPLSANESAESPLTKNPFDFFNFHAPYFESNPSGTSFPSFHFTMYFAVAKVCAKTFNNYWIPYGVASIILLHNFDNHDHWVSDMVAGALMGTVIGTAVGNSFYGKKQKKSKTKRTSFYIVPSFLQGTKGVQMAFQF